MKGGAGLRRLFFVATSVTTGRLARSARTWVSALAASPISGLAPSMRASSASNGVPSGASSVAAIVQYSRAREGADLPLALHDEADGDRLDAAGRQPGTHLARDEGAERVADQAVDDPPGLLGVDQVLVDLAGPGEGLADRGLRDLAEGDPGELLRRERGGLGDVPGDRLALAVEVGGEEDPVGRPRRALDRADVTPRPVVGDHVLWDEAVLDVHPQLPLAGVLGQVPDVPVRGEHGIARPEVALDRLRLGGRLDDHQIAAHGAGV